MKAGIKSIFLVILAALVVALGALSAYALIKIGDLNDEVEQLKAQSEAGQSLLADEGFIFIRGAGYFYYQRVSLSISEAIYFQGVTFAPYVWEGTITAPLAYWLTAEFEDGTTEQLQYVGFYSDLAININITQHDNPHAGVMLIYDSAGNTSMYFLVSEIF